MPDKSLLSLAKEKHDKALNDNALRQYVESSPTANRDDVSLADYVYKKLGVGTLNIGGALTGFAGGAARTIGADDTADYLDSLQEEIDLSAQGIDKEAGGSISAIQGEDSLWNEPSLEKGLQYTSDLILTQAPQFLVGGAAAKVGTAVAPLLSKIPKVAKIDGAAETIGALLGTTAAMTAQETGSIYGEQEEKNFGKALAYGLPAGTLEAGAQLLGMKRSGLGGYIAKGLEKQTEKSAKQIGIDILKSSAEEGLTEGSQSFLEQLGASRENNPIKALENVSAVEMLENAIAGTVMGGTLTGAGNVARKTSDVTKRKLEVLADRAITELSEEATAAREEEVASGVSESSILPGAASVEDVEATTAAQQTAETIQAGVAATEAVVENDAAEQAQEALTAPQSDLNEEPIPKHVHAAAKEVGADPVEMNTFASSLVSSVKTAAEFTRNMVAKFGEGVKKYALQIWNSLKSKLVEQRGSFSTSLNKEARTKRIKELQSEIENIEDKERPDIARGLSFMDEGTSFADRQKEHDAVDAKVAPLVEELKALETAENRERFGLDKAQPTYEPGYDEDGGLMPSSFSTEKNDRVQETLSRLEEVGLTKEDAKGMTYDQIDGLIQDKIIDNKIGTQQDGHEVISHTNIVGKTGDKLYIARKGNTIAIDKELAKKKFANKAWTKPREQVDGSSATPLSENAFPTFRDFIDFSIAHEVAHSSMKQGENESTGSFEDRINAAAMSTLDNEVPMPVEEGGPVNEVIQDEWFIDEAGTQTDGAGLSYAANSPEHKAQMWKEAKSYLPPRALTDAERVAFNKYLVDKGITEDGRKALYAYHADEIARFDRNEDYDEFSAERAQVNESKQHSWTEGLLAEELNLDDNEDFVATDRVRRGESTTSPEAIEAWKLGKKYSIVKTLNTFLDRQAKIKEQMLADETGNQARDIADIPRDENYFDESVSEKFDQDNDAALETAAAELSQNKDLVALSEQDKKEGRKTLAEIILQDIVTAIPFGYVPSVVRFIKKEEGINSLGALDGYPDSLIELVSHGDSLREAQREANTNLFEAEHKQSVANAEFAQSVFDATLKEISDKEDSQLKKKTAGKLKLEQRVKTGAEVVSKDSEPQTIPAYYAALAEIEGAAAEPRTSKKGAKAQLEKEKLYKKQAQEALTDALKAQSARTKHLPIKERTALAEQAVKEKLQKELDNKGLSQQERLLRQKMRADAKAKAAQEKRVALRKKQEENQEKVHKLVVEQAKENQIMISMFPDFFAIVKDIVSAGKHQAIKRIRTEDVAIKLKKNNKAFAELSPEKRDDVARRMILLVNSLGTESFRIYTTRQELGDKPGFEGMGNPEMLHSQGAENNEIINHEINQLGMTADQLHEQGTPEHQLIDSFVERASSLNLINYIGSYVHFVSYKDSSGKTHYADGISYTEKQELIDKYGSVKTEQPSINQESPYGMGVTHALVDVRDDSGQKFTVSYRTYLTSKGLTKIGKPYNAKPGTRLALNWIAVNELEALVDSIIERTDLISEHDIAAYVLAKDLRKAKTAAEAEKLVKSFYDTATKEAQAAFELRLEEQRTAAMQSEEYKRDIERVERAASRKVSNAAHKQKGLVAFYKMVGRAYLHLSPKELKTFYSELHSGKISSNLLSKLETHYSEKEHFPTSETLHKSYKKIGREGVQEFHKFMKEQVSEREGNKELAFYRFFSKQFVTSLADSSRAAYVMSILDQNLLANPDLLEKVAADYAEYGIKPSDISNAYVALGGSKIALSNYVSQKMQDHFYQGAEKALRESAKAEDRQLYILSRYDQKTQDLFIKYLGEDKSKLAPAERLQLEAIEYVINNIGLEKDTVRTQSAVNEKEQLKREVIRNFYKKPIDVATQKHTVGLDVYPEDIFSPKADLDTFEQQIVAQNANLDLGRPLEVGTLKSKMADRAYRMLAKVFGADLVIVHHANGTKVGYKSRYIPKSKADGRPKLVINVSQQVEFSSLFAHELFHHVVNKADPAQYKAFTDELVRLASTRDVGPKGETLDASPNARQALRSEEIQAELFAEVMFSKSFYESLSKTSAGKSLAGRLMTRLMKLISKVYGIFTSKEHRWVYEFDGMIDQRDMKKAMNLMADLVADSFERTELNETNYQKGVRYWTPLGHRTKDEVKQISANKDKWLGGTWKKLFPKGTKNHKELMTGIEDLVVKLMKVMASIKPQGFIADWMSDKTAVKYAHWLQNYPAFHVTQARKQVTNARKNVFRDFINDQSAAIYKLIDEGNYKVNGVKVNPKNKSLVNEIKRDLPKMILQQLHDDIVRGQLDFTKDADIKKAKDLGYTDEIIDTFKAYKKITDELYAEMKKVFPHLKMNKSHYGQSIKWFHEGNVVIDESFERILTGNNRMFKGKDFDRSTQEIADDGNLVYETIDPHELFLNYVRDATRLMQFQKVVNAAIKSGHAKIFKDKLEAKGEGFNPVVDSATRVIRELMHQGEVVEYVVRDANGDLIKINGQPMAFDNEADAKEMARKYKDKTKKEATIEEQDSSAKSRIAYWTVSEEVTDNQGTVMFHGEEVVNEEVKYEELKRFMTEAEAIDYSDSLPQKTRVDGVFSAAKQDDVAQIYFSEDLAKLINITLAEDNFRNGKLLGIQGKHALWVKNAMTSFEFALSGFHAITISIELLASYATWQQLRYKGPRKFLSGFNFVRSVRESREIAALMTTILTDVDYAKDPAVIKRASELLGVTDVDILEVLKQYFTAGGLEQQDPDLRSRMNRGHMRYATGPGDHIVVEQGEAKTVYGKMSSKAMMDSFKEVYADELVKHPNNKALAAAKTVLFAGAESTTSWLMEGFIPKVKMATWVREYTLALEKNADKIERGEITKEEIGRQRMKFVEDRFGEVNWKNMWMNPSIKSALQFTFRSFTWFTGGWKALGKASIGLGKQGWFKIKGEDVEITQEGVWGINVLIAHMMAVSLVALVYQFVASGTGEVPDEEETPWLTRMLFPRIDPRDPYSRVSIPSYITEGYKLLAHVGAINTEAEYAKLLSGRVSSIITNSVEAFWTGEDWRGVSIRDEDENFMKQSLDTLIHVVGVLPISISTVKKNYETKGLDLNSTMLALIGMTGAPAAAKRTVAANLAFSYRRKEFKGKEISPEEAELKDATRKAAYLYGKGIKEPLRDMLRKQQISRQKYENALKRIPYFGTRKNPAYQDPLYVALSGLSIDSALKVWDKMSSNEKKTHRPQVIKKYHNTVSRGSKSYSQLKTIQKEMRQKGVFK